MKILARLRRNEADSQNGLASPGRANLNRDSGERRLIFGATLFTLTQKSDTWNWEDDGTKQYDRQAGRWRRGEHLA